MNQASARDISSSIAMTILIVSWAMFFATLFLAYFVFRFSQPTWPPGGIEKVALNLPVLSTVVIVASSISYYFFEKEVLVFKKLSNRYLIVTILLAVGFILSQFALWNHLNATGLYVSRGVFTSLIHGFTWIHAAHIVLGFIGLIWVGFSVKKKSVKKIVIKNVGIFWHFLTIVWLLMFTGLFVF